MVIGSNVMSQPKSTYLTLKGVFERNFNVQNEGELEFKNKNGAMFVYRKGEGHDEPAVIARRNDEGHFVYSVFEKDDTPEIPDMFVYNPSSKEFETILTDDGQLIEGKATQTTEPTAPVKDNGFQTKVMEFLQVLWAKIDLLEMRQNEHRLNHRDPYANLRYGYDIPTFREPPLHHRFSQRLGFGPRYIDPRFDELRMGPGFLGQRHFLPPPRSLPPWA